MSCDWIRDIQPCKDLRKKVLNTQTQEWVWQSAESERRPEQSEWWARGREAEARRCYRKGSLFRKPDRPRDFRIWKAKGLAFFWSFSIPGNEMYVHRINDELDTLSSPNLTKELMSIHPWVQRSGRMKKKSHPAVLFLGTKGAPEEFLPFKEDVMSSEPHEKAQHWGSWSCPRWFRHQIMEFGGKKSKYVDKL